MGRTPRFSADDAPARTRTLQLFAFRPTRTPLSPCSAQIPQYELPPPSEYDDDDEMQSAGAEIASAGRAMQRRLAKELADMRASRDEIKRLRRRAIETLER
eukprot:6080294-Pleurochrysis_carterae.AAC.1